MPYAAPNPLLDDLQAEVTAELIRSGNLTRKKSPPAFSPVWTSLGYVAVQELHSCKCGSGWISLRGLFHREKAPSGETRDQALARGFQLPLNQHHKIETVKIREALCPDCLSSHGFSLNPN